MKIKILFKVLIILPLILIIDYVLMVLLGCASFLFGVGNNFYCGTYCKIGKAILLISAVFFIYFIFSEMKLYLNHNKNVKTL